MSRQKNVHCNVKRPYDVCACMEIQVTFSANVIQNGITCFPVFQIVTQTQLNFIDKKCRDKKKCPLQRKKTLRCLCLYGNTSDMEIQVTFSANVVQNGITCFPVRITEADVVRSCYFWSLLSTVSARIHCTLGIQRRSRCCSQLQSCLAATQSSHTDLGLSQKRNYFRAPKANRRN